MLLRKFETHIHTHIQANRRDNTKCWASIVALVVVFVLTGGSCHHESHPAGLRPILYTNHSSFWLDETSLSEAFPFSLVGCRGWPGGLPCTPGPQGEPSFPISQLRSVLLPSARSRNPGVVWWCSSVEVDGDRHISTVPRGRRRGSAQKTPLRPQTWSYSPRI